MRNSFLFRIVFMVFALAAILAVIVAAMSNSFSASGGSVQSQTLFEQFIIGGGPIVWFVLLPMSLVTVYLAVEFGLNICRKRLLPGDSGQRIVSALQQFGIGQLEAVIGGRDDFVSAAVVKAVAQGRGDWFRMRSVVDESLQDRAGGLLRRIEWLSLIGNVSPMVGLFGTVFGMIKLFNAIVTAGGQPQPAQLAEGISIALVTTFWGLFIAIPALAIHGIFRNRIETLASEAVEEAEKVMPQIRAALKNQQAEQLKQKQPVIKSPIQEIPAKSSQKIRRPSLRTK